jgi:GNAT superfamily N-acetyltransferase
MPDAAIVRLATTADIPAMHRVRTAVSENRLGDPSRITPSDYAAAISELGCGWVAEVSGALVGFAVGYRSGNIWALFVHPDHEGCGHGKALHCAMVSWLWAQGLRKLWLTTDPGTRAEAFYRSQGWRSCGRVSGGELRLELDRPSSGARSPACEPGSPVPHNVCHQEHRMRTELVTEAQHEALIDLLGELHTYYNEGSAVPREVVREHLEQNLLAAGSPLRLVVASTASGELAGLAAIAPTFSLVEPQPDKRRHIQLKELYVRSAHRGQGAGRALMAWVARYAVDRGFCRIDWPVKASNSRGIAFYEGLGAQRVTERLSYRLSGPRLIELAQHGPAAP